MTSTTATITWSTNVSTVSDVDYGLTSSYGLTTPLYGLALNHSVSLTGLSPGTTYHYRVTSQDPGGAVVMSADSTFTTLLPDGGTPPPQDGGTSGGGGTGLVLAINAGGNGTGSFLADTDFSGGAPYSTTASINTSGVTNPAPQAVYQTERFGSMTYTLPGLTAGASYTVRLHFAEIYFNSAGQRTFNVSINGQQVLSNFDIWATAGGENIAIVRTFNATANSGGQISVVFTSVVNNAKVSGIEVLGAGSGGGGTPDAGSGGGGGTPDAGSGGGGGTPDAGSGGGGSVDAGSGAFPVTSATLRNRQGTNVEPGMRPWRYNGPQPDSFWCTDGVDCLMDSSNYNAYQFQGIQYMIDREMQLAASLGVATIRVEFDWPLIEKSRGNFDWSRADYIVREAVRYGLQLQPILVYTPLWASGAPTSNMWYANSPANVSDWTNFVTQIVSRYHTCVHYWEIWNEPDGGGYWYMPTGSGLQDWVTHILNPGYAAIKAVDSSAQVIVGPDHADTTWYSGVVQYGGGGSFDIIGFHSYTNAAISETQTMQAWANQNGMGQKPIWIGEYGFAETTNTTSDTNHQALLTSVISGSGYQQAQFYTLRDELPRSVADGGITGSEARYFGVIQHDDATMKAGFSTFQSLINQYH